MWYHGIKIKDREKKKVAQFFARGGIVSTVWGSEGQNLSSLKPFDVIFFSSKKSFLGHEGNAPLAPCTDSEGSPAFVLC